MNQDSTKSAERLLFEAARTHGVRVGRDELLQALADPEHGAAFAGWANTHLGEDNLLSPDEMALYNALDKSGQVDKLAALHDLSEVQAFREGDIRTAIEELHRSTAAISKQTESIRQQQDALARMVSKASQSNARRTELESSRQRTATVETKSLGAEVEDLAQSLSLRVSDLEQQTDDTGADAPKIIKGLLSSDDKLLSSLQKLGRELDQESPEDTHNMEKLREICMRLIKHTVETIRTKLDRLYLESLINADSTARPRDVSDDEVQALQEEVESLYSEILPVAQMAVEQQYLEPASKSISARGGNSLSRSMAAVTYISECLDYLLDRMVRLKERMERLKSHQAASALLIHTARTELSSVSEAPEQPTKSAPPVSPVRPRTNTATSRARRRSSGILDEPPLEALLQSLAIALPSNEEASREDRIEHLGRVLSERSAKAEEVDRGAQESFETSVAAHLDDMRRAVQRVKDSILADSPYGDVKLMDPDIEEPIELLSGQVEHVKETLAKAERSRGSGKSEKKAEILERWGN